MAHSHVKSYLVVYISLLLLVVLTVGVAHVPTGLMAFPIALSIAFCKAILIVTIFMHLKDEVPLVRIFAIAGIFWLGIFFTILMADYLTRENTRPLRQDAAFASTSAEVEHSSSRRDNKKSPSAAESVENQSVGH